MTGPIDRRGRKHAVEATFDPEGEAAVRAAWRALSDAGLPSRGDHGGPTHRPHLTLASALDLTGSVHSPEWRAVAAALPVALPVAGLLVLGSRLATLAWALTPDDAWLTRLGRARAATPDLWHPQWLAHVTLATRLTPGQLAVAIATLSDRAPTALTVEAIRWWNPARESVTELGESPAPSE